MAKFKLSAKSPTPTSPENFQRINAAADALQPLVLQLAGRWLDEREYENIEDYAAPIKAALPAGFTLLKMIKRPFGFTFSLGTDARYQIDATTTSYGWKRIA